MSATNHHLLLLSPNPTNDSDSDSGPVVPTTPLVAFLERIQETAQTAFGGSEFDPKSYVDMSLKSHDLASVQAAFDALSASASPVCGADLGAFLGEYFEGAGEDLVGADAGDFVPEPEGFLPAVRKPEVRAWCLEVHGLWKGLSRRVSDGVLERPESHTLLPLTHRVMVPGSRFREVYYWDSYWVIR